MCVFLCVCHSAPSAVPVGNEVLKSSAKSPQETCESLTTSLPAESSGKVPETSVVTFLSCSLDFPVFFVDVLHLYSVFHYFYGLYG